MMKRFPKRGFRAGRFNNLKVLNQLNLEKLHYHIQKGDLDPHKLITMKDLLHAGVCSKIKHGVKLLSRGGYKI